MRQQNFIILAFNTCNELLNVHFYYFCIYNFLIFIAILCVIKDNNVLTVGWNPFQIRGLFLIEHATNQLFSFMACLQLSIFIHVEKF